MYGKNQYDRHNSEYEYFLSRRRILISKPWSLCCVMIFFNIYVVHILGLRIFPYRNLTVIRACQSITFSTGSNVGWRSELEVASISKPFFFVIPVCQTMRPAICFHIQNIRLCKESSDSSSHYHFAIAVT